MTKDQLELLFEYIEARFDVHAMRNSEDGGLPEHVRANKIKQELLDSFNDPDE